MTNRPPDGWRRPKPLAAWSGCRPFNRVLLLLIFGAGATGTTTAATTNRRPNILWLIGENLAPDLGCYGVTQVKTPALDALAAAGVRYAHAFATAPVCSTSRSAFMTGMFQTSIGAHNHRSHRTPGVDDRFHLPAGVRPITHWFADAGYHTANISTLNGKRIGTGKTDLNFEVEGPVRRASPSAAARKPAASHDLANSERLFHVTEWTELERRQPFFAQVNFPNVERAGLRGGHWVNHDTNPRHADPARLVFPPYYPDTPELRADWAGYLDSVSGLDTQVAAVLRRLEADGLADDTIVVFFGDNGRLEARGLDWCYDSGLHVPLIIRWPKNHPPPPGWRAGGVDGRLVTLIDVTATTLSIAGIRIPDTMQGRPFLGAEAAPAAKYVFGARDRTDNAIQRIRTVRTERHRYIRNFMPGKPFLAPHTYKDAHYPVYRVLREWLAAGKLTPAQATLTAPRLPDEELYDVSADPFEVRNLAPSADPEHRRVLLELRTVLDRWIQETRDQGDIPEKPEVIAYWEKSAQESHGRFLK